MFVKQAVDGLCVCAQGGRFANGLAGLFRRFKAADGVLHDLAHPPERHMGGVEGQVFAEQPVVKGAQCLPGERLAAGERLRQRGVGDESPADHQRVCTGAGFKQRAAI